MAYVIDLNPRQSTRTLEQAIRHGVQLILEPRLWAAGRQLECKLEDATEDTKSGVGIRRLVLSVESDSGKDGEASIDDASHNNLSSLVGTYCDVIMPLGEQRYLFSTHVIQTDPPASEGEASRLHIVRPEIIQVVQRRRFHRLDLSHSTQVELGWITGDKQPMGGVAWLCNISGEGLACRTEGRVADAIWIGEKVNLEFALTPGESERFKLEGTVCSKTSTGKTGKVVLGIQFLTDDAGRESADAIERLRHRLLRRYDQLTSSRKGAES